MSKVTSKIEKETFIGLVINKLANTGHKDLTSRIRAKSDLKVRYKTAQRYAREYIYVRSGEQEKLLKELRKLVEQQADVPVVATTESEAEAPVEVEAPTKILIGEVEYYIEDVEAAMAVYENGGCAAEMFDSRVSEMCHWLVAIDDGKLNGTIAQAKQFINIMDDYCEKLRDLIAARAKKELKEHLQQVKELESVLDRTEVDDIWLEVGTEKGELIITPFSEQPNQLVPVVEPINTLAAL